MKATPGSIARQRRTRRFAAALAFDGRASILSGHTNNLCEKWCTPSAGGAQEPPAGLRQSSGAVREFSGTLQEPSGALREPSGAVRESSGGVREPSGAVREPAGAVREPAGTLQDSSGTLRESANFRFTTSFPRITFDQRLAETGGLPKLAAIACVDR